MLAAHVARDLARIGFLLERHWAPYSKWLTTAFAQLTLADQVGPQLRHALSATLWRERKAALCARLRARRDRPDRAPLRYHATIELDAKTQWAFARTPARNVNATTTQTITVTRRAEVSETARWPERLFDALDDVEVDAVTGHRPRPGLG
jgi:hypothetical protein